MKAFSALTLALILTATTGLANDIVPLAPGKPAGVRQAQREEDNRMWLIAGAGLLGIGIALAVADGGSAPTATSLPVTSTATTTTP